MQIKGFSIRLLVALATLTMAVIAGLLWFVPRFGTATTTRASMVPETLRDQERSLPEGWRRLEISAGPPLFRRDVQQPEGARKRETRGRITIGLPPDMNIILLASIWMANTYATRFFKRRQNPGLIERSFAKRRNSLRRMSWQRSSRGQSNPISSMPSLNMWLRLC